MAFIPSEFRFIRFIRFKRVFSREAATDSSCGRQPAACSPTPFIAAKRRQIIEGVSPLVGHKYKMLR